VSPWDFLYASQLVRQQSAIVLEPNKAYLIEARLTPMARAEGYGSIERRLRSCGGIREVVWFRSTGPAATGSHEARDIVQYLEVQARRGAGGPPIARAPSPHNRGIRED
jgi:hypothetical protein